MLRHFAPGLFLLLMLVWGCSGEVPEPPARRIPLFDDVTIHFTPDDSTRYDSPFASARDNGRVMATYHEFTPGTPAGRATLELTLRPIRKAIREVHDRWDRAGWVRLVPAEGAPVEMMRFMTSYGGETHHSVDVSRILPLLQEHCEFEVFIDTWVTPAWEVDATLVLEPASYEIPSAPTWSRGLFFPDGGLNPDRTECSTVLTVPQGNRRVELALISTGHCTDGTDADEFIPKDNVLLVDGEEVLRWRPWRDDCRDFRDVNPYCAKWADGSWSSDYSRSGWCPGDIARPYVVDATDWLPAGRHTVTYRVEDIRPRDGDGNHGYWRVSGTACGW